MSSIFNKKFTKILNMKEVSAEELKKILASNLKFLMLEKNLNITQLSKQIKIPRTTINAWLNCKILMKVDYLYKLSLFFDVPTDFFFNIL